MEDILASIKRIIAEDSEAVGARAPRLRREAMAAVAASPVIAQADADPEPEPDQQDESETTSVTDEETPDILELTSPMTDAASAEAPATPKLAGLTSSPAAEASRNAFAALGQMQVRVEEGQPNTLEGLVADLLKPMLKEYLDRELPGIVERLVSAEVARLSGRN